MLALTAAQSLPAQIQPWQNQWYWGAKGGVVRYTLPTVGGVTRAQGGGEWMITAQHAALYVSYSTTFTQEIDNYPIKTPASNTGQVSFDAMQRIQVALLVLPWGGPIQPYVGGGFVIESLSNPTLNCAAPLSANQCGVASDTIFAHAAGGFALVMAGVQIRVGKLAIYGQAQISPQGRDFILPNSLQSIEFGVRYAFLGSREEDVTTRR